jgi:hypothetical protein
MTRTVTRIDSEPRRARRAIARRFGGRSESVEAVRGPLRSGRGGSEVPPRGLAPLRADPSRCKSRRGRFRFAAAGRAGSAGRASWVESARFRPGPSRAGGLPGGEPARPSHRRSESPPVRVTGCPSHVTVLTGSRHNVNATAGTVDGEAITAIVQRLTEFEGSRSLSLSLSRRKPSSSCSCSCCSRIRRKQVPIKFD